MKDSRIIGLVAIGVALLQEVSGQDFVNLNFESSVLSTGGPPATVSAAAAFPGWNTFIGTNAQSTILYNDATLGNSSVAILAGGSLSPVSVYDGKFSALLVDGATGYPSLRQTGLVPANARSLLLYANFGPVGGVSNFSVSLGGQNVQMVALQNFVMYAYTLYGGDISSFAGQVADLGITALNSADGGINPFALDDIQFSSSSLPAPEPGAVNLFGICILCFWRRIKRLR